MSKYQNYSMRQLLEAVRNGRTDVGIRAGEEIQRRIKELEQQNAALLAVLKRVEWVTDKDELWLRSCPWCDNYARTGHKSDCVRQAAIAAAKAI